MATADATELRRRIDQAEAELRDLRAQLAVAEAAEVEAAEPPQKDHAEEGSSINAAAWPWPLLPDEYERYARQLILPAVGVRGQQRLRTASVLVVGAGGLGCPAAAYLAGAGVGHVGVVDGDVVEASNLHRQIGHATAHVGEAKAASLVAFMRQLNPLPRYTAHAEALTPSNAMRILGGASSSASTPYTLVLDCTDHPAARYLVSDACVRAGVPLVSAAALRTDGQLTVLNWPVGRGPCYRCVFPRPPPPASQQSCAEGGVLGPVVGVMGVLQALEALRVLLASPPPPDQADQAGQVEPAASLLLFSTGGQDALRPPTFRTVRLRGRRPDCVACGPDAPLRQWKSLDDAPWPDYARFCGGGPSSLLPALRPEERISVAQYAADKDRVHWLLDVREKAFFDLGSLAGAVNIPFSRIQAAIASAEAKTKAEAKDAQQGEIGAVASSSAALSWLPDGLAQDMAPVYLVCRVGNDSQTVTRQLKDLGVDHNGARFVGDIAGGILAWKREMDSTIPFV